MKYRFITYILVAFALLTACSTENDVTSNIDIPAFPSDESWTEELMDGASATVKGFLPGDQTSRTSLVYDGQSLVFGWKSNDRVVLYPTAHDLTNAPDASKEGLLPQDEYPHPSENSNLWRVDPKHSSPSTFICQETTSQTTKIENGQADFIWDDVVRWSAYCQKNETLDEEHTGEPTYEKRYFSFADQQQKALADVGEYFENVYAQTQADKDTHLNKYRLSEAEASEHLGMYDILISPETKWEDGVRINFQMRHIGAIARLYLRSIEEGLVIKEVRLICEKAIFHEKGSYSLISHPYDDSQSNYNYGVNLNIGTDGCQISAEDDAKKSLKLDFTDNCVTKKSGSRNWGPYVVAYIMMFPITYNPATDGDLFAYITATKPNGEEVHYVSEPLSEKTMKSGFYYQWSPLTHPDDGLYPIEMTATLKPWQEIVGADIDLDLEK